MVDITDYVGLILLDLEKREISLQHLILKIVQYQGIIKISRIRETTVSHDVWGEIAQCCAIECSVLQCTAPYYTIATVTIKFTASLEIEVMLIGALWNHLKLLLGPPD